MPLEKIGFGNPAKEFQLVIRKETYLDSLLNELRNYPYPDDEVTREEVSGMIDAVNNLYIDPKIRDRFQRYDTEFDEYIAEVLSQKINKEEVVALIKELSEDINPLLLKLKYHYQRIRPFQFAYLNEQPLFPYLSKMANTPSYPSGHSFQAYIYCEVLGNRYPQYYGALQILAEDIALSRFYLGVHFPSDIEFAKYCGDVVLNHPDFKKKYKL
jgi:hypothetical protein